eukprot:TRINITY_DN7457_c0_g1_i1.p1 TRINITY_DN7457_c0_g1~~TRINITY_DN7457_c0_g1_i1.p1  ORF type:complete len:137 (-),score=29.14 TRINITY_DN7457_c0_g1_i1:47-403(-)
MSDFASIGQQFVNHYYNVFDSNREGLRGLYSDNSMLTFEGDQIGGSSGIMEKLTGLPACQHRIVNIDCQPCPADGVLVFVSGDLLVDENPLKFSQVFNLQPANGSYYVLNDLFRFAIG